MKKATCPACGRLIQVLAAPGRPARFLAHRQVAVNRLGGRVRDNPPCTGSPPPPKEAADD